MGVLRSWVMAPRCSINTLSSPHGVPTQTSAVLRSRGGSWRVVAATSTLLVNDKNTPTADSQTMNYDSGVVNE